MLINKQKVSLCKYFLKGFTVSNVNKPIGGPLLGIGTYLLFMSNNNQCPKATQDVLLNTKNSVSLEWQNNSLLK